MGNVNIINHPLVKHKITLMRDEKTGTREFRILVEEVAMLMGYEAMRDLPTETLRSKHLSPQESSLCSAAKACYRAYPEGRSWHGKRTSCTCSVCKVGHIGLYRDEVTQSHMSITASFPIE